MADVRRTVIVTGATGGIGRAIVSDLQREGFRVIGSDLPEALNRMKGYFDAILPLDLRLLGHEGCRTQLVNHLDELLENSLLAGLVNNAAVQIRGGINDTVPADFMQSLDVNVTAPFLLTQICYPYLKQSSGTVVNIGSIHSRLTKPGFIAYATSKSALEGLTRALAIDCGDSVRVNMIQPAAIQTEMLASGFASNPEGLQKLSAFHPSQCIGQPEEIATLTRMLIRAELPFLNGSVISLDGGIGGRLHDPE